MPINKHKTRIQTTKMYDSWIEDLKELGTNSSVYNDDDALQALANNKASKLESLPNINSLTKVNDLLVKLDYITITTPPNKTAYAPGDTLDTTGMVVTAYYDNNTSEVISDYTIDINKALTKEDTKFTISYTYKNITKTIDQNIVVNRYLSM